MANSLELLPLKASDPRNAQAAMSRFAGKLAFQDVMQRYQGGSAKRVSVLGTGSAGMGAALAAKELGLPVQMFGRREQYRELVESYGIQYHVLPDKNQSTFINGYLSLHNLSLILSINQVKPLLILSCCLTLMGLSALYGRLIASKNLFWANNKYTGSSMLIISRTLVMLFLSFSHPLKQVSYSF